MIQNVHPKFNSEIEVSVKIINNFLVITDHQNLKTPINQELNTNVSIFAKRQPFLSTNLNRTITEISFIFESIGV